MKRRLRIQALEPRRLLAVYSPQPDVADGDAGSLRAAVVDAQANNQDDTIRLSDGVYRITQGDMLVNEAGKRLEITGAGQQETIIVIDSDSRWLDVDFDAIVDLSGVTVLGGHAEEGGQLRNAGDVTISDARLQAGRARQGGSILNGGSLQLNDVDFWANTAGYGGAVWNHADATVVSVNTEFIFNRAEPSDLSDDVPAVMQSLGIEWLSPPPEDHQVLLQLPSASAVVNAGDWDSTGVEVTQSMGGLAAVVNFGQAARLTLDQWVAHQNDSGVLYNAFGNVKITRSDSFDNQREKGGLLENLSGNLDLYDVDLFNNSSRMPGQTIYSIDGRNRLENVNVVGNASATYPDFYKSLGTGATYTEHPGLYTGIVQAGYAGYLEMTGVTVDENVFHMKYRGNASHPSDYSESSYVDIVKAENLAIYGDYRSGGGNRIGAQTFLRYANELEPLPEGDDEPGDDVWLDTAVGADTQPTFGIDRDTLYPPPADLFQPAEPREVREDGSSVLRSDSAAAVFSRALVGTAVVDGDEGITYSPPADYFGREFITILDHDGTLKWQVVDVLNEPDPPVAMDDHYIVLGRSTQLGYEFGFPEIDREALEQKLLEQGFDASGLFDPSDRNSPEHYLQFVANDDYGPEGDFRVELTSVTDPEHGHLGRVASSRSQGAKYYPRSDFAGLDSFQYTITNSSGLSSTATVTIQVLDPSEHPKLAEVKAEIVDADGNTIERVRAGETFFVETSISYTGGLSHPVQSLRKFAIPTAGLRIDGNRVSVAETYVNDAGQVLDVRPEPLAPYDELDLSEINGQYVFQRSPSRLELAPRTAGLDINGPGPHKFYRFPIVAAGVGEVTVTMDPTLGYFLGLVGYGDIPHDWVNQIGDSVEVVSQFTNIESPEDVNQDETVSAVDALIVINALTRQHAGGQVDGETSSSLTADAPHLWDVDGNGQLTALDALRVINRISREHEAALALIEDARDDDDDSVVLDQSFTTIEPQAVDKIFSAG